MTIQSRLQSLSLRDHLTLVSAAAVAAALALASLIVFAATRHQLRNQLDSTLSALAAQAEPENTFAGRFEISLDVGRLSGERGLAQFVPASGNLPGPPEPAPPVLDGTQPLVFLGPGRFLPITEKARAVAAGTASAYYSEVDAGGIDMRVYTRQVAPGLAVQVAQPLDEIDSVLSRLLIVLVAVTLGGALLAATFGRAIAHSALARVGRLTQVAEQVTASRDFSTRMEVEGRDELSRLAASFNSMLHTLEGSIESQRQLVADASHELRTPLTSIRTNIEVLERARDLPEEERIKLLSDVTTQIDELTSLVGNLVELARDGAPALSEEEVRLDELVQDAVDRARRLHPNIEIATHLEPSSVRGDRHRLERAVVNLLDNAAKWTPPGEPVEVEVKEGSIEVRDRGPGVAPADLPHIFDRFYRAPAARGKPGSGLGLAIVSEVAAAHGGSVSASNAPQGGAIFRLELPGSS